MTVRIMVGAEVPVAVTATIDAVLNALEGE